MRRGIYFFGALIFMIGTFLFVNIVWAENGDIVINEICSRGCASNISKQWVEIYNRGNHPVDISGWRFYVEADTSKNHKINTSSLSLDFIIPENSYGIIAYDEVAFLQEYGSIGKLFSSTWGHSLSTSEVIGLKYDSGDNSWVEKPFLYPTTTHFSLERISATTSAEIVGNWQENLSGNSVGLINYWTINSFLPPTNQLPIAVISTVSSSLVNESVIFSANSSTDDGTIVEYQWLVDGSIVGTSSTLNYIFSTTGTSAIDLLVRDDGGLSNSTSTTIFVDAVQTATSTTSTPSSMNLKINEFMSDPSSGSEWLELYNVFTSSGDLTGWTLSDNTGIFISPTGTISAGGFFILEWSASRLNNAGDIIVLKNSNNEIVDQVCFGDFVSGCAGLAVTAPSKGNSIARKIDGVDTNSDKNDFAETTSVTKNYGNSILGPIMIQHTSSGSGGGSSVVSTINQSLNSSIGNIIINELYPNPIGPDEESEFIELKNIGLYAMDLLDWYLSDSSTIKYTLSGQLASGGFVVFKRPQTKIALNNSNGDMVRLFRPNGSLVEEITYNGLAEENWSYSRNVSNTWLWTVTSTPEKENIFLSKNLEPSILVDYPSEVEVGEDVVFDASNSTDSENDKLDFVWKIGQNKINGNIIHYVFTRAGERIIELVVSDNHGNEVVKKLRLKVIRIGDSVVGTDLEVIESSVVKKTSGHVIQNINLSSIREYDVGDLVRVQGIVAVEPGIFGSQYFYIVQGDVGVQVYMNKKDFPILKVGDLVVVSGELSQAYGELRLKVKSKTDIKVMKPVETRLIASLQVPNQLEIVDIGEEQEGSLIMVQGEITELKTSYMYVDDGTDEFRVYFKKGAGIDKKQLLLGQKVKVIGIISQNSGGYQLLPRGNFDIEKISNSNDDILVLQSDDKTINAPVAETYLTATAGGLTSILIGLLARARGKFVLLFLKNAGKIAFSFWQKTPKV